jgi:hypothetical protein
VKIGKLLSAKKILVGSVSKLGTSFIINARIIDVEKGEMEFGDKAKADTQTDLDLAAEIFAKKLAARIHAKQKGEKVVLPKEEKVTHEEKVEEEPEATGTGGGGFRLKTTSLICMGVGLASGGVAFLYQLKTKKAHDAYVNLAYPAVDGYNTDDWAAEWDKVLKPQKTRNFFQVIGMAVGGAGLIMYGIDYFFLKKSSEEKAMLDKKHNWNLAFDNGYKLEYTYRW